METKKEARCKEDQDFKNIRVESVTFYQRGRNDKAFRSAIKSTDRDRGYAEFYDLEVEDAHEYFAGGVLVHNCHMVSSYKGQYGYVLQRSLAPVRIGVTATMPYKPGAMFALEGLVGPKLAELTVCEGNRIGIIAKPEIRILDVPNDPGINQHKKYQDVYQAGVVENMTRNMMIVVAAKQQVAAGKSVLINVSRIDHGKILEGYGKEWGLDCKFIHGADGRETRDKVKAALDNKETMCVIASPIFKEGVNIRTLNTVINAAGGKSEIATLQALGRGLRVTRNKKTVLIIDLKDTSNKYLRRHYRIRWSIYKENGWISDEEIQSNAA